MKVHVVSETSGEYDTYSKDVVSVHRSLATATAEATRIEPCVRSHAHHSLPIPASYRLEGAPGWQAVVYDRPDAAPMTCVYRKNHADCCTVETWEVL